MYRVLTISMYSLMPYKLVTLGSWVRTPSGSQSHFFSPISEQQNTHNTLLHLWWFTFVLMFLIVTTIVFLPLWVIYHLGGVTRCESLAWEHCGLVRAESNLFELCRTRAISTKSTPCLRRHWPHLAQKAQHELNQSQWGFYGSLSKILHRNYKLLKSLSP